MTHLTIEIPDDLARELKGAALAQSKSMEQVALERLGAHAGGAGSAASILRAMKALPHLNPSDIDELNAAIASARLPVNDDHTLEGS